MRKIVARGFVLEFVSIIALIFAIALAWLGDYLGLSAVAVVSASVGISVAAFIWALKWEINRELRDKLPLYTLLESIEDEDLYDRAKTAIEECRVELENLSKGILRIEPGRTFHYAIRFADYAKHHFRAVHVGLEEEYFKMWDSSGEQQWYQHNLELVKRGVIFERIFVLSQTTAIDNTSGKLSPAISAVLQKQQRDGIRVRVVWKEKLEDDPELLQDFGVADTNIVFVHQPSWSGGYTNARIYRRKFDVDRYIEIFETLRTRAQSLSDLSDLLPPSEVTS